MVLLTIVASMVAPRMSSFFHGRVLSSEARRMLSLMNYAQSRAVAEGVPVLVWIDPAHASYGMDVGSGHVGADDRNATYAVDPSITLEAPSVGVVPTSESDDERLGLPEGMPAIRFNPDGFFDELSVQKIVLRQGTEGALEIAPTVNRLRYEIRPFIATN